MKNKIDFFVIERVKEKRIENNFSQAALAYELGMSVGFIGKVESKKYDTHYNLKHLNDLARILNCSPQDFSTQKALIILLFAAVQKTIWGNLYKKMIITYK